MPDHPEGEVLFLRARGVTERKAVREFAAVLRQQVAEGRAFVCLLTDDKELQRLNREFLGKDYATDVLSFPAGNRSAGLGELAISVERAREQADEHGHKFLEEVRVLMLHGVLHLMGMDHETDGGRMRRAESRWRKKLGLPAGLIERVRG
ncbi:MAG: rRNA maturation RNase YbeY [Bryobacterales bacterium]|nr:rRNA maturation RNase YbeY [Bryobacterales bacterium]